MGLTPLEGLIMGTRSGDVDPGVLEMMAGKDGKNIHEVVRILNKESGVLDFQMVFPLISEIWKTLIWKEIIRLRQGRSKRLSFGLQNISVHMRQN